MVTLTSPISPLLLVISSVCAISGTSTTIDSLQMVHVLFRHGDRAPFILYPNDPWKSKSSEIWPEGLGQLTKIGKAMEYQLGSWLRNRYGSFIKKIFDPEEVNVMSTDTDRTLMSAECVVAGFYRPDKETKFIDDLFWTPIPIHSAPSGKDELLNVDAACPRIASELSRLEHIPEVKDFHDKNEKLFQFLSLKSGFDCDSLRNFMLLYDALRIEKLYNLTLPNWGVKTIDEMEPLSNFFFDLFSYSTELKRLRGGPLLKTMAQNMKSKSNNLTGRKMLMFSGHDTTVSVLLNSMGVYNGVRPPYSATVLVELHKIGNNNFVKMFYQNDTSFSSPPHELIMPGCPIECPLHEWLHLLSDIIPEDWDKECNNLDSLVVKGSKDVPKINS